MIILFQHNATQCTAQEIATLLEVWLIRGRLIMEKTIVVIVMQLITDTGTQCGADDIPTDHNPVYGRGGESSYAPNSIEGVHFK